MSYEAGSTECRLLIDAKRNVENAISLISGLSTFDHIESQLISIHNQLEEMHDLKKKQINL